EPAVGIVHFHGPIKIEWTQSLESLGLTILRYLPQDAFVVRGPSSTFAQVAALPAVDWTGPYAPQWRPRPDLPRDGVLDVRVVVFPGESPEAIEAWIGHQGIPPGFAAGSGPAILGAFGSGDFRWARARIPANLVAALTALPSVEFVDPVRDVHDWNAETDWVIQSNATANYRYWNVGLDATGQVVGQADTGLDYDGDQFRQSAGTIVSGDLYNTTDLTRRKVVRYLNMGVLTGQLTWPGGGAQLPGHTHCRPGLSRRQREHRRAELSAAGLRGPLRPARTRLQRSCRAGPDPQRQLGRHRQRLRHPGPDGRRVRLGPSGHDDPLRRRQLPVRVLFRDDRHSGDCEGH